MRKKLLYFCLCLSLSLTGLVGCGKEETHFGTLNIPNAPEEDLEAQAELEAQELERLEEERIAAEEAKRNAYMLATPTVDITVSSVNSPFVQVGNAIVKIGTKSTLRSTFDCLVKESGIENLKLMHNGDEVSQTTLINPSTNNTMERFVVVDDKNSQVCNIETVNVSGDIQSAMDSIVVTVDAPEKNSPHILNFFYPGNICAGSFQVDSSVKSMDNYKIRMKDYPVLDYMSLPLFLKAAGAEYTSENGKYEYSTLSKSPVYIQDGVEYYKLTTYSFGIDLSSSIANSLTVTHSVKDGSQKAMDVVNIGEIEELPIEEIENVCIEALKKDSAEEYPEDSKLAGYYVTNKPFAVVWCGQNEDGENLFVAVELKVERNYNGMHVFSASYVWSNSKNTLEKMCKYQSISADSIVFTDNTLVPVTEEELEEDDVEKDAETFVAQ